MTEIETFHPDDLSEHAESLRRLARGLIGDPTLADDAVQQTFVTALERPPRGSLKSWLHRVVRTRSIDLLRDRQRREERHRALAREEASRDALELQNEILQAVRALREPYRTSIYERYWEGLAPREIARRHNLSVKTVKTRLCRALAMLRERLSRHRSSWMSLLATIAAEPTKLGVLAMNTKKLGIAATGILLALGAFWMWPDWTAPVETADPIVAAAGDAADGRSPTTENNALRRTTEPATPPAPRSEPYGSLMISAHWSDGTPATGVAVIVTAKDEPATGRAEQKLITDDNGSARASRVHSGNVTITSDRGGRIRTQVRPGEQAEAKLKLSAGVDVEGKVIDSSGSPVPGASIWLTAGRPDWLGAHAVARSGVDGTFRVRAASASESIGARADGYAPSALFDLEIAPASDGPTSITLRLTRRGAAVRGTVLQPDGSPMDRAIISIGERAVSRARGDFTTREVWPPIVTQSERDGRFLADGLEPGRTPIAVRAEGYPQWTGQVELVPGAPAEVLVRLETGVTVRGTVTDDQGHPVAGAVVTVLAKPSSPFIVTAHPRQRGAFPRDGTVTRKDGSYEFDCVRPGRLYLFAGHGADDSSRWHAMKGIAQETRDAVPGEVVDWNPKLSVGLAIRGVVVKHDGSKPSFMSVITATPQRRIQGAKTMTSVVGFGGKFLFPMCKPVPYTIELAFMGKNRGPLLLENVVPGGPEVKMTLPNHGPTVEDNASVVGSILDTGNRLRRKGHGSLSLMSESGRYSWSDPKKDGSFEFSKIRAGRHRLLIRSGGRLVHTTPWFEVPAGARHDLGKVETAKPGTLVLRPLSPTPITGKPPRAQLHDEWFGCELEWNGAHWVRDNLSPGTFEISLRGHGWVAPRRSVTVKQGERCTVDVELKRAVTHRLRVTFPEKRFRRFELLVRDATGAVFLRRRHRWFSQLSEPFKLTTQLPLGSFTVGVKIDDRAERTKRISVTQLQTAGTTEIDLR